MTFYPIGSSMSGPNLEYFLSPAHRAALAPRSVAQTGSEQTSAGRPRRFWKNVAKTARLFGQRIHDARRAHTGRLIERVRELAGLDDQVNGVHGRKKLHPYY